MSPSAGDRDPAEMVTAAKLRRAGQAQLAGVYTADRKGCHLDNGVAVIIGSFDFEGTSVGDAVAGAAD